jgi:hypothetical protein
MPRALLVERERWCEARLCLLAFFHSHLPSDVRQAVEDASLLQRRRVGRPVTSRSGRDAEGERPRLGAVVHHKPLHKPSLRKPALQSPGCWCCCRSLKKPPGDWTLYHGDDADSFEAEGFTVTERDRAGLGKGPLRLYFRVGVGGCAQPDTAHAAVPRACSALAHLTLPFGGVCAGPRGPAAHCGCARKLCSPFPQQSLLLHQQTPHRRHSAAAADPCRRPCRRPCACPCFPTAAAPAPAARARAVRRAQLSARVRPGRAVRVRLPVLVSTHRPLASGYDCCWVLRVLRVLRGLRVLRALPVRLPLVLLVLHELRLCILVQHRRRPRRRPATSRHWQPAGGGGLGVGARAVPLQLAPLLLRLLRLLRLASARRLAASLFVSTFCSGTPCCLCCANEHGQSGGAAEGALLWQDGQRLCPGTGEKVRRTLLPARPRP